MAIAWKATRNAFDNGVARIDTMIPPDQDNLRNRYPELVEGPFRHICPKLDRWFDRLTMSGLVPEITFYRPLCGRLA